MMIPSNLHRSYWPGCAIIAGLTTVAHQAAAPGVHPLPGATLHSQVRIRMLLLVREEHHGTPLPTVANMVRNPGCSTRAIRAMALRVAPTRGECKAIWKKPVPPFPFPLSHFVRNFSPIILPVRASTT